MMRRSGHRSSEGYAEIKSPLRRWSLHLLNVLDSLVYALVGLFFIGAALLALGYSLSHLLFDFHINFPLSQVGQFVLDYVSDLLLVLIIMEVLGTVRSYLEKGDTSVRPFLYIGIISATRGILSIGARLSIQGAQLTPDEFNRSIIELGIDALVIIALGVTIRVMGKDADSSEASPAEAAPKGRREKDRLAEGVVERVTVETALPAHHHIHPDIHPDIHHTQQDAQQPPQSGSAAPVP